MPIHLTFTVIPSVISWSVHGDGVSIIAGPAIPSCWDQRAKHSTDSYRCLGINALCNPSKLIRWLLLIFYNAVAAIWLANSFIFNQLCIWLHHSSIFIYLRFSNDPLCHLCPKNPPFPKLNQAPWNVDKVIALFCRLISLSTFGEG